MTCQLSVSVFGICLALSSAASSLQQAQVGLTPQRVYSSAYADYVAGEWRLAIEGFETYIHSFPTSDLAGDAQYYIGEAYLQIGQSKEALAAYDLVLQNYPRTDKAAEAHYKRGVALEQLRRFEAAQESFAYVVKTYPNSTAGGLAKRALENLSERDKPQAPENTGQPSGGPWTNQDVISTAKMAAKYAPNANSADSVVAQLVLGVSNAQFELSPKAQAALRSLGVSDPVIFAMQVRMAAGKPLESFTVTSGEVLSVTAEKIEVEVELGVKAGTRTFKIVGNTRILDLQGRSVPRAQIKRGEVVTVLSESESKSDATIALAIKKGAFGLDVGVR